MLRFNFAEVKESKFDKYVRPDIFFVVFILLLVFAVDFYWEQAVNSELAMVNNKIQKLEQQKKRLESIERKERELIGYKEKLKQKLNVVSELKERRYVPQFLYFFGNSTNRAGVWLDSLSYRRNGLSLVGNSMNLKYLYSFIGKVDNKLGPVLFKNARLQTINLKNLNKKINYYKFQVNLELRNGISH